MNNPKRKGSAFYSLREHRLCSASPRRFEPRDSDYKIKKEFTKSEFFFLVGTIGLEKALPFIRYANTDYVRLRRGGSSLKIAIKIKKESTKKRILLFGGNNRARKGSAFYSLREHRLCSASPRRFEPKDSDNKKKESTKSEFFFLVGTIGLEPMTLCL